MKETQEYLLAKADGVKDCVKWLKREIKKEQSLDDGSFFSGADKGKINEYSNVKVSLEKYAKKLRHQARELKE